MNTLARTASLAIALSCAACTWTIEGDPRAPLDDATAAAPTPETQSLFGQPLFAPEQDDATRAKLEHRLDSARKAYGEDEDDRDSASVLLDVGRRMADLGMWRGAMSFFDEGVAKHPDDARLRDARGRAHLALREFELAESDFAYAVDLVDPIGPAADEDGTIAWRVPLHLGVARFVRGDFAGAAREFATADRAAMSPDEHATATVFGIFASTRAGARDSQQRARAVDLLGSGALHPWADVARLFRGDATVAQLLPDPPQRPADAKDVDVPVPPSEIVLRYGAANWLAQNGKRTDAIAQLEWIVKSDRWPDLCAIAAEADLRDLSRLGR